MSQAEEMEGQTQAVYVEEAPLLKEALSRCDNWTSVEDRAERRRAQNRLNQRAVRRRKKPHLETPLRARLEDVRQGHQIGELSTPRDGRRQEETRSLPGTVNPSRSCETANTNNEQSAQEEGNTGLAIAFPNTQLESRYESKHVFDSKSDHSLITDFVSQSRATFPLSLDHLLPLIHTNIYRAVLTNLILLRLSPNFLCSPSSMPSHGILTLPLPAAIPPSLLPTQLQMSVPHPEWMNIFPMPSARDALIRRWVENRVDQCGFCFDMLGELEKGGYGRKDIDDRERVDEANNDYRQGLIIWGDPWVEGNWEITDGFVRKWGWVMQGCKEGVLRSTNYWRGMRGEESLGWVEDVDC